MKVLIPVDGSESAQAMLEWASRMLNKSDASIYLLTVISDAMTAEYKLEEALQVLDAAKSQMEAQGATVAKSEYMTGDPVERICQYADDENVDQILLGSHGRSGLAKVLLGSVSEGVLERCGRPVFIYRPQIEKMAGHRM